MSDVRPWYACSGDPCTCPKPVSIDYRVAKLERIREFVDGFAERGGGKVSATDELWIMSIRRLLDEP